MVADIIAHGVASRGTLPLPFWQLAWVSVAVLGISFAGFSVLWKKAVLPSASLGRALPFPQFLQTSFLVLCRFVGFLLFFLCVGAGLYGVDNPTQNITPVTIYVIFWVGCAVASAFLGDIWRLFSPYETFAWLLESTLPDRHKRVAPDHKWFGVAGLFGFLLLELVHPSGNSPRILAYALFLYSAIMFLGIVRYGRSWLDQAEGFGILFSLIAACAPLYRNGDGRVCVRTPLSGLSGLTMTISDVAIVMVVLGGTSFDGFVESTFFVSNITVPSDWSRFLPMLVWLGCVVYIAWGLYQLASVSTGKVARISATSAATIFGASLIPILLGYTVAHYAQLLVDQTQKFWFLLSNPYGFTDPVTKYPTNDFFGAATNKIDFNILDVDAIAWVQAIAILIGHIAGVLVAHDRGLERFDRLVAVRSQYVMLFIMMVYSISGLGLLFIE